MNAISNGSAWIRRAAECADVFGLFVPFAGEVGVVLGFLRVFANGGGSAAQMGATPAWLKKAWWRRMGNSFPASKLAGSAGSVDIIPQSIKIRGLLKKTEQT